MAILWLSNIWNTRELGDAHIFIGRLRKASATLLFIRGNLLNAIATKLLVKEFEILDCIL